MFVCVYVYLDVHACVNISDSNDRFWVGALVRTAPICWTLAGILAFQHHLHGLLLRLEFLLFALGLHPGDEAQQSPPNNRGDTGQVEGYVVGTQSVPQIT